jgi:hypothetical protein
MIPKTENEIEEILKVYSLVSDREDETLRTAVLKLIPEMSQGDLAKADRFLERFSEEKPFGDILLKALSSKHTNLDTLSDEIGLSRNILEKILNRTELPNIIPIKKMKNLLQQFHIPTARAIDSIRVSMNRFSTGIPPITAPTMAVSRHKRTTLPATQKNRSKESLKRGVEAYIKRLLDEEKNDE